jgi:glutamate dehydrogenase (NAD(P)+)
VEYRGGTERQALATIAEKIEANTRALLDEVARSGQPPRKVAVASARVRVATAMAYQRH